MQICFGLWLRAAWIFTKMIVEPSLVGATNRGYELLHQGSKNGELPRDLLEISMGPQHPSTH